MSKTQGSMVAKSAQLQSHVDELLELVGGAVDQHTPIHEVEKKTLQVLLQMGRTTLQILLDELGSGDVGESVEVEVRKEDSPTKSGNRHAKIHFDLWHL